MNNDQIKTSIAVVLGIAVLAGAIAVGGSLKQTTVISGPTNTVEKVVPISIPMGSSDAAVASPLTSDSADVYGTGSGLLTFKNDVKFGSSGAQLDGMLYATGTRDFDSLTSNSNVDFTSSTYMTVTGASVGDPCFLSLSAGQQGATSTAVGSGGNNYVTSTVGWKCSIGYADTAFITAWNYSTTTSWDPPSGTMGVFVMDTN